MIVILDAGHGLETKGKSSPDNKLQEWKYAREIVNMLIVELERQNIKAIRLVPENKDISLSERVKRVNLIYKDSNKKAILISVHCNAAGADGKWHDANGWSVFIAQNASNNSKKLANCLYDSAKKENLKLRLPMLNLKYWVLSLAICRDTNCPAVLTENMFLDNLKDVEFLLSDEGKKKIVNLHVNGILNYGNRN